MSPGFSVMDIEGNPVSLKDHKGQKVHLNFYRFAGCPFCNLRFHEIDRLKELYIKNNVKLISVYESSAENMRAQMNGEKFYATMVPNPDSSLYVLYDLERSARGLLRFLFFKGGLLKALKGNRLFGQAVKPDGHADRVEAEFLIGQDGRVVTAYYGKHPGDNLPLEVIKIFVEG